jgi:spore maturation protein CgeB
VVPAIAAALERRGVATRKFYALPTNTLYDRFIIHTINHQAHNLRLVPKSVDLFAGHPKSHKEYRSQKLVDLVREFRPELIILTRGLNFKLEALKELREIGVIFCWFIESETRLAEFEPELPHYDHTYFFSTHGVKWAQKLGYQNVSLLQHAVDTASFRPLPEASLYDWCFVGQWHLRRQEYVEGLSKVSRNFVVYGTRWRKHLYRQPYLWLRVKGAGIWGENLVRLYNQTRVVINVSVWGEENRVAQGVNLRLLEVPACRTCLLTDYTSDADRLLIPGKHFVAAANLAEMQEKLAELLADADKRRAIAQAGYARASQIRTYDDLVAQVLQDWAAAPGRS